MLYSEEYPLVRYALLSIEGSLNRVKDYSGESSKATILKIGPTKNGKTRKIPLLPALVQAINLHFFRDT